MPSLASSLICSTCKKKCTDWMRITARYIPSMPHCHPARYNPAFMYPHVRSNPDRYITSAGAWSVRCKLCCTFSLCLWSLLRRDKQLAAIYDANFKAEPTRRRAFIIRSHNGRKANIGSWIKKELHAMSSERNSLKCTTHPDALQSTHQLLIRLSTDGPTFYHNYTRGDMNPVASFTQEHPIAISRDITRL